MKTAYYVGLTVLLLIVSTGCTEPPVPPEVQLAIDQEQDLWRAGANIYVPDAYADYQAALKSGRLEVATEKSRLSWLRNYEPVATKFRTILVQGEQVQQQLEQNRSLQLREMQSRSFRLTERLLALRDLSAAVRDSRLNTGSLSRAEVNLNEAASFARADRTDLALARLEEAELLLDRTVSRIRPILAQYIDKAQISRWQALVDEVVTDSRHGTGYAIVVNKLRRQLIVYRRGVAEATYPIGLGFNPIGDKLYAGDRATPEGRYRVVSKKPNSTFFRALLLNYPNADDQRRFAEAKRRKLIPADAAIGGLIEIHGGGKDGATLGCIGLDDKHMLDLFNRIEVGTPVAIVATLRTDNLVRLALGRLE